MQGPELCRVRQAAGLGQGEGVPVGHTSARQPRRRELECTVVGMRVRRFHPPAAAAASSAAPAHRGGGELPTHHRHRPRPRPLACPTYTCHPPMVLRAWCRRKLGALTAMVEFEEPPPVRASSLSKLGFRTWVRFETILAYGFLVRGFATWSADIPSNLGTLSYSSSLAILSKHGKLSKPANL